MNNGILRLVKYRVIMSPTFRQMNTIFPACGSDILSVKNVEDAVPEVFSASPLAVTDSDGRQDYRQVRFIILNAFSPLVLCSDSVGAILVEYCHHFFFF